MVRGDRVVCVSATVREHVLRHYPWVEPARLHEEDILEADQPIVAALARRALFPGV